MGDQGTNRIKNSNSVAIKLVSPQAARVRINDKENQLYAPL